MKPNQYSICTLGCKYLKKCHADKNAVVACKRYEPTEEYKKYIDILKELEEEKVNEQRRT